MIVTGDVEVNIVEGHLSISLGENGSRDELRDGKFGLDLRRRSLSICMNKVNKAFLHYGPDQRKTLIKLPSNQSLSHERGSERSERASE